jgi:hypothetical protein
MEIGVDTLNLEIVPASLWLINLVSFWLEYPLVETGRQPQGKE